MAINVTIANVSGDVATGSPGFYVVQVENDTASDITLAGISLEDKTGLAQCGAFIPCFKVATDIYSAGTPELNQVPAWGTPEQSSENISGDPLIYYPANESGVAYVAPEVGINYVNGTYGGQYDPGVDPLDATSAVIPAGETKYYMTTFVSNVVTYGTYGNYTIPGAVENYLGLVCTVQVAGINEPFVTSLTDPYLYTGRVIGLNVVPVGLNGTSNVVVGGAPNIISQFSFARNPQYANFDFLVKAYLVINDESQVDVTEHCEFTSSDTDVLTVVASGPYTIQSTSIVGADPKTLGGGGACSITYIDPDTSDAYYTPAYAEISTSLAGFDGSTTIGAVGVLPIAFRVEQGNIITARNGATQTYDIFPVIVYQDGYIEDETGGGFVLMEFDAATNGGDGISSGACLWDDQDYGYFTVDTTDTVVTSIRTTWIDDGYPILMGLPPITTTILVNPI